MADDRSRDYDDRDRRDDERERRDRDDDRGRYDDRQDDRRRGGTSGMAIASLILGIGSCTCLPFFLPGIAGLILAIVALTTMGGKGQTGKGVAISGLVLSVLGTFVTPFIFVAILMSAMQRVQKAAERIEATNNAKQIALAFHSHNDVYKKLPTPDGAPAIEKPNLLSWRVALLPFIEQQLLFERFDRRQAWDGPKNQPLLNQRPRLYRSILTEDRTDDHTPYQVFVGPGALYPDRKSTLSFGQITDGTSNTILFAEGITQVPWSKPADMEYAEHGPLPLPEKFMAAMCDGSIRVFDRTKVSDKTLRALISPKGGEELGPDAGGIFP